MAELKDNFYNIHAKYIFEGVWKIKAKNRHKQRNLLKSFVGS